ncbi:MAG: prolipoprotein diacylglyceryl transferase [Negativicutes bacterium]|nr:prolipoprotein diacylglyceryl transferase [Negativicutes bacterium]
MHQYLFHIGSLPVRSYGAVMLLSIALAGCIGYFLARQDGRWHRHVLDITLWGGLCGFVGARLWDVFFFDWSYYRHHLGEILFIWQGGMAIQGGVIGGVLGGYLYTVIHRIDSWDFADRIAAPAIVFGQAVGRAANLLNGDAFGHPTGGQYGVVYPPGTLAHATYGSQPLWPAEVWEGQADMVIFALLLLFRTTNHAKGQVFALYFILYSLARFFLEYLRGDYPAGLWQLKAAQMLSLATFLAATAVFVILEVRRRRRRTAGPA